MGLIRAGLTAFNSTMADEWKEYIYADSIRHNIAQVKGEKQTGKKTSNKKGNENVISKDSIISVNEGQAMVIIEDGKVCEYSEEPGQFLFDSSSESSIFAKDSGIGESFKKMGRRFTFGGDAGRDIRVYYFNLKELTDLKFGTSEPVMYDDPIYQSISVRFFGQAVLKIKDPIKFYTNVSGNVEDSYNFSNYWEQILKSEFISKMSEAIARLALDNIKYNQIPQNQSDLTKYMNECLDDLWFEQRGITIETVGISSISLDPKDKAKIDKIDDMRLLTDPLNAAARMTGATATAMESAAANENGAMNAFMGMGMASMQGANNNLTGMYQNANTKDATTNSGAINSDTWACSCGVKNTGKFCSECGNKKPVDSSWVCECGAKNTGKFCSECGNKKPENTSWTCDCGTSNTGKFCSNCGEKQK